MTEFRKGDVVTVQGVVEEHDEYSVSVILNGDQYQHYFNPKHLTLVRRGFNVGDRVMYRVGSREIDGTIMAIDNNDAWVKTDDGSGFWTFPVSSLRHAVNSSYAQLADILPQPKQHHMTYTQWLAELKSKFDVAEEYELARAIYSFQYSYSEGLTPAEAYERFDAWACEDAA